MSCVWMLQRGHSGDGCVLSSTLCKYDLRKGDLFVLSWARVRRVRRGSLSSELLVCGGDAALVCSTKTSESSYKKMETAQNAALRTATEAHKMESVVHLHQESLTLKVKDHSDMLSAQYLVNCLEEDHVCHGITTQEPIPRSMKETFLSRHHSTVLRRLGVSRKESLQNLHTHVIDSNTNLLGNNRVLKERPPPISDEVQRLNRRQRCTLSQLRSGQEYKHRVFGEPCDICTGCGVSP